MRYNSKLNKYVTTLYENEIYDFIYTSNEYQNKTIRAKGLNPNEKDGNNTFLTGQIDKINNNDVYDMEPIIVEKLLEDKSLKFVDGSDKEFSELNMIYGDNLNISVKSDNIADEYLDQITANSSDENIVSVIKDGSSIKLKANKTGEATINVTVPSDGKYKKSELSFKVTVEAKELGDEIEFLGVPQNPKVNSKSNQLKVTNISEDAGEVEITYYISKVTRLDGSNVNTKQYSDYVEIDSEGKLSFHKACRFKVKADIKSSNLNYKIKQSKQKKFL